MKQLIKITLILLLSFIFCTNKTIRKEQTEVDNYSVIRTVIEAIANYSSGFILNLYETTIPTDSIQSYYSLDRIDYPDTFESKVVIDDFKNTNHIPCKLNRDQVYRNCVFYKKEYRNVEELTQLPPRPKLYENDTLKDSYVRISLPAFDSKHQNAIIYYEQYLIKGINFGRFLYIAKQDEYWAVKNNVDVWVNSKHRRSGLIGFWCYTKNIEEDTILYRSREEILGLAEKSRPAIQYLYDSLFCSSKPKGSLTFDFSINCAGDVLNLKLREDEIGNNIFSKRVYNIINEISFKDNLNTIWCGEVETALIIHFDNFK